MNILESYREEFGGIGKPGLDESGEVEDDGATGAGGEERGVVGDIAVDDFERCGVGRRGKGGEVAGGPDEDPDGVTLSEEGVTEPSAEVAGCAGHQYLLHSLAVSI